MDKRQRERLELEGNSVFTDLRNQRDALLEALEAAVKTLSVASLGDKSLYAAPVTVAARAAIAQAKGEK